MVADKQGKLHASDGTYTNKPGQYSQIDLGSEEFLPGFRPSLDDDNWWPTHLGDTSDLPDFSGDDWAHVLDGDGQDKDGNELPGGGHLWNVVKSRKIQGKTAFPPSWGAAYIGEAAAKVLRKAAEDFSRENHKLVLARDLVPDKVWETNDWKEEVWVDGKHIAVTVSLSGLGVLTVYPECGDGISKLLGNKMVSQEYKENWRENNDK